MIENRYYDITDEPVTFQGYRKGRYETQEETFQGTFKDRRCPDVLFLGKPPIDESNPVTKKPH